VGKVNSGVDGVLTLRFLELKLTVFPLVALKRCLRVGILGVVCVLLVVFKLCFVVLGITEISRLYLLDLIVAWLVTVCKLLLLRVGWMECWYRTVEVEGDLVVLTVVGNLRVLLVLELRINKILLTWREAACPD
jgi:hypothetical protein